MLTAFWLGLALKMAASAGLVVGASLIVERAGPLIGAMVATLPISAGPAYVALALEHGPDFIARSALGSLAAIAGTMGFVATYGRLAQRRRLAPALGGALATWIAAVALITRFSWGLPAALTLDVLVFAACVLLTRTLRAASARGDARRRWDIPLRAAGVMTLVAVTVLLGRALGPQAAGLAALAPVVLSSLCCILQPRIGGPATAAVMANASPGVLGNAAALALVHMAAPAVGSPLALLGGLAVSALWNAGLVAFSRAAPRVAAPKA